MSTLAERWKKDPWKQVLDQFLHLVAIGAPPPAIVLGLSRADFFGWEAVAGCLAALWVAGVREFEQRPVNSWGDLFVDLAFGILGGTLVGVVFMVTG